MTPHQIPPKTLSPHAFRRHMIASRPAFALHDPDPPADIRYRSSRNVHGRAISRSMRRYSAAIVGLSSTSSTGTSVAHVPSVSGAS